MGFLISFHLKIKYIAYNILSLHQVQISILVTTDKQPNRQKLSVKGNLLIRKCRFGAFQPETGPNPYSTQHSGSLKLWHPQSSPEAVFPHEDALDASLFCLGEQHACCPTLGSLLLPIALNKKCPLQLPFQNLGPSTNPPIAKTLFDTKSSTSVHPPSLSPHETNFSVN